MPHTVDVSTAKPLPPVSERLHGTLRGLFVLEGWCEARYIENPYFHDYTAVGGHPSIDGGALYSADGVCIGHVDMSGPPGAIGARGGAETAD